MKVEDITRTTYLSFQADDLFEEIVKGLAKTHLVSAPVFDGSEFIGIVSDASMIDYFKPKQFLHLWKKDKPTPLAEIRKVTAGKLAKPPKLALKTSQDLFPLLKTLAERADCIPVYDGKKLHGFIYGEDILQFFQKELAKGEVAAKSQGEHMDTEIDALIKIVQEKGEVSALVLAKQLGMSTKTVEKLGESLANHHLVELKYTFLKGVVFKRVGDGKK